MEENIGKEFTGSDAYEQGKDSYSSDKRSADMVSKAAGNTDSIMDGVESDESPFDYFMRETDLDKLSRVLLKMRLKEISYQIDHDCIEPEPLDFRILMDFLEMLLAKRSQSKYPRL